MNDQNRFAQLARRVAGRLPAPLHTGLQQLRHRAMGSPQQSAPLLTVVVVATNAEPYLSACLDSLRSQTLKRIEVLVVDNGSTDHTVAIPQEFADQDPIPGGATSGARIDGVTQCWCAASTGDDFWPSWTHPTPCRAPPMPI